jgi:methylenetetrahydrofolate dehydrogenase (NADP+) / methenyltetrahydrofolate cyclohydrolase
MIARVGRQAAAVERKLGRRATLAIVAGADAQSRRFVQVKQHLLEGIAFDIQPAWLPADATTGQVEHIIAELNRRDDLEAIFLQFPLPAAIGAQAVADAIDPRKDVDCSGAAAEEQFAQRRTEFTPVAPHAALILLNDVLGSVADRRVAIHGSDDAFGRALRLLLQRAGADVRIVTAADAPALRDTDALVLTESLPPAEALVEAERLAVVLDAGYYLPPRAPNQLADAVKNRVGVWLKQYGNVGPLTVANLADATVQVAARRD